MEVKNLTIIISAMLEGIVEEDFRSLLFVHRPFV